MTPRLLLQTWRGSPSAVLPLAFLQSLDHGLINLPVTYLLREIDCDIYGIRAPLVDEDICRSTVVQRAYTIHLAAYLAILTTLSVLVSGPYGRLSDTRGRKPAMAACAVISAAGDLWLCLSSLFPRLRSPYLVIFGGVLKGLGGGAFAIVAAQTAFIADTSSTANLSMNIGFARVLHWVGLALGPLISAALLDKGRYATNFIVAVATWALYLAYLAFFLQETRSARSDGEAPVGQPFRPKWTWRVILRSIIDPLRLLFSSPALRWLSIADMMMALAAGGFDLLVVYCDRVFGMRPKEAGVVASINYISRAFSVLFVLPAFVFLYRRFFASSHSKLETGNVTPVSEQNHDHEPSEEQRLIQLEESDGNAIGEVSMADKHAKTTTAKQELVICRFCFVVDALGMLFIGRSKTPLQVSMSTAIGSLGAPAGPSIIALLTLVSSPDEFGRMIAGVAMIEAAATVVRDPTLFAVYAMTLDTFPSSVWYLTSALFAGCAVIMACLRPVMFTHFSNGSPGRARQ